MSATLFASFAIAQATPPSHEMMIDIKPQPIVEALNDWAQQTGLQLIVPEEATDSALKSRAVRGGYTAQAALDELLIGMPLTYTFVNSRTVAISGVAKVAAGPRLDLAEMRKSQSDLLIAGLAEVIVTGSRLRFPREDIRADGSIDTPAPVTVFDRGQIDASGASGVAEFLRYVPQQPFNRFEGGNLSGAMPAELRGVGSDVTLVLINGRRTPSSANTIESNIFDLNTIPLAAVERMEVLSDSASAVYGADAVGGVVNVILKKEVPRPTLDLHYGGAAGGAEEHRVSLSGSFSTDRLRALAILDYFDRGFLLGSDRDRWRDQDYRRFGGDDGRSTSANPGNVSSLTPDNLPGLPSTFAAVPVGSSGVLTPEQFLGTAGRVNKQTLSGYSTIIPKSDRRSVATFTDFDIASGVNAFAEVLYAERHAAFQYEPSLLEGEEVPASNPFNPFGTAVAVDYFLEGVGPTLIRTNSELLRAIVGVRGALGSWDWEVSSLRTTEDSRVTISNEADPAEVRAALAASDPERALNVFEDGPGGSAELLASLVGPPRIYESSSIGAQHAAVIRGPLFNVPGGAVEGVVGGEFLESDIDLNSAATQVKHGREAHAAFAELRVPLVGPAMQVPAVNALSLTVAARNDHYSDFGDTFNPQYGLVWRPVEDLLLRASHGTSFRAPSLFELYAPQNTFPDIRIPDPDRNETNVPVNFKIGGNPDLDPTEADSLTAGFVLTPSDLEGLTLSSTYWRVRLDNKVRVIPFFMVLANEQLFADRIVREAPTAEDIALGRPGKLTALDISRINFGSIRTSGADAVATYSLDTPLGRFVPSLSGTWVHEYKVVELPGTSEKEIVSVANSAGTILKWRALASLSWTLHGMGLSAVGRYSPAYADAGALTGPNGRKVGSQTLLDVQAFLDFDEFFGAERLGGTAFKLTAGVSNLLDAEPRFSSITQGQGFDPTQGDLRQRFVYMRLSASF